ncbi:MAG: hypothetical protein ACT4PV_09610 [Planctomycetaceae bacterium]
MAGFRHPLVGSACAALLLLQGAAACAPELLREEAYNYRITGELPPGWARRGAEIEFSYTVEGIPHAHIRLVRERVAGEIEPEAALDKRRAFYAFPGAEAKEPVTAALWAGQPAAVLEHRAELHGVACLRRVTVMEARGIWYERIETIYGDAAQDADFLKGAELFRDGFKLLVPPLPRDRAPDTRAETLHDPDAGYRILKPEGWLRREVDPASDPGCRTAFERPGSDRRLHALARLYEYGPRRGFDLKIWMDSHYRRFAAENEEATREAGEAPKMKGAERALAERYTGKRDKTAIAVSVLLLQSPDGRLFALRITTYGEVDAELRASLEAILAGFEIL